MGILLSVVDPLHLLMALVSWATWPGFVKGMEITLVDIIGLAIYLSLPRTRTSIPFGVLAAAYLASVVLSVFQSGVPQATMFYAWQLLRVYFLFIVTARACASNDQVAPALLKGMSIGICLELCMSIWERFVLGEFQVGGTFGHQNSLGISIHFVIYPLFALWLAGSRGWQPIVVPIAGIAIALLTASRATIGLVGAGYAMTLGLSARLKWTARKGIFAVIGIVLVGVLAPVAFSELSQRGAVSFTADATDERTRFENAAAWMLADHPMGIGANTYVVVANTQGYNQRAGVVPTQGSLTAHVHNVYRLVAAETGYFGIVTFVLLLLQPLRVSFVWGWRARGQRTGDLLLGLGVSLLMVYIHSFYEWILVTFHFQYLLAVNAGMIVGLAQQIGYPRKAGSFKLAPPNFSESAP